MLLRLLTETVAETDSTNLYTEKAQAWVQKAVGVEKAPNSFLYLAYQNVLHHDPLHQVRRNIFTQTTKILAAKPVSRTVDCLI